MSLEFEPSSAIRSVKLDVILLVASSSVSVADLRNRVSLYTGRVTMTVGGFLFNADTALESPMDRGGFNGKRLQQA